ncbi:MAG: erythromycin esterase family protein [Lachnospiraceae bacterium]|nr:erythromycin esterase family protein [Lachnospiraceae bacterium]
MKVLKKIVKVLLSIVLVLAAVLGISLNMKTVLAAHKNKAVIEAANPVAEFTIPEGVKIVGVGEASHGSVEFQELKLDVFQILVEKYDYRAFALEADFSDCLAVNEYIQGGEGDARDIANHFYFDIYRTQQMADLVEWMREYNASVPEDKRLRFYGFDLQNPQDGVVFLKNYMESHDITGADTTNLDIWGDENSTVSLTAEIMDNMRRELAAIEGVLPEDDDFDTICAHKLVENIGTALDYWAIEDMGEMISFRDQAMAANVSWLLELEQNLGTGKIMLAAHNAHIGKCPQSVLYTCSMGGVLKEQYGDAYYSLGTDFFKGKSNIHATDTDERKDFFVTTADPMAYQAKYMEDHRYYMDFTSLDETDNAKVYNMVHEPMNTGSLGEGFCDAYYLMHSAYRLYEKPVNLYDGMIFYYEVAAIEPAE